MFLFEGLVYNENTKVHLLKKKYHISVFIYIYHLKCNQVFSNFFKVHYNITPCQFSNDYEWEPWNSTYSKRHKFTWGQSSGFFCIKTLRMWSFMPGLRALKGVKLSQILALYTCLQLSLKGHKVDWNPNRRCKCKTDGFLYSFFIILQ